MAKCSSVLWFLCLVLWWSSVACQPVLKTVAVLENYPQYEHTAKLRIKVIELAVAQLGVRERTGRNDGVEVEKYLRAVGLRKGDAWCAAFISWLHMEYSIPNPESGYSPNWFRNNLVYDEYQKRLTPFVSRPGQVIGLWIPSKGRIGHVGMIETETRGHFNTIEGNTNGAGSDEGDGVYRKIRKKETVSVVSDFVGWKEYLDGVRQATKSK